MIQFVDWEMTEVGFARENAGFDEHTLEHGNPIQTSEPAWKGSRRHCHERASTPSCLDAQ